MTRFLNGPVVAVFLAAACALTAYVLVTGAQTRRSATLTERGPAALDAQGLAAARLTDAVSTTGLPPLPGAGDGRRPERRRSQRWSPRSLNIATLTEGEVRDGYARSVKRAFTPRGSISAKQDPGASPSVNVAYHHRSYPVDFRHRWILEKAHRLRTNTKLKAEHAHVQRLLDELRRARHVQAHEIDWRARQIAAAETIGHEAGADPWPNCPDPIWNGAPSWDVTVACENGGDWMDSPGYYRCGLQFDPMWERRFGALCP